MDGHIDLKLPKNLTFNKVLTVFKDYLDEDDRYEIVKTSRGYYLMGWDTRAEKWDTLKLCDTPQIMVEYLLDALEEFIEYKLMRCLRDPTEDEQK